MITTAAFEGALLLLHKRGPILEVAREVGRILAANRIEGAVIGGVAVVLHGHARTTLDVDVFVGGDLQATKRALESAGFTFDRKARRFWKGDVAVDLVTIEEIETRPRSLVRIDGVPTVSLPDLVTMKLRSGLAHLVQAIDLADVIGLIRNRGLTSEFARQIPKDLRAPFRKLVRAVRQDSRR
jgi:hypothetical protein